MEANIIFNNVKAYNVIKFDVKLDEDFTIELVDTTEALEWFANNDNVLHISVADDGKSAKVKTTGKGVSKIQLQTVSTSQIVKTLFVEVYDLLAVSLNPQVGPTVLK